MIFGRKNGKLLHLNENSFLRNSYFVSVLHSFNISPDLIFFLNNNDDNKEYESSSYYRNKGLRVC